MVGIVVRFHCYSRTNNFIYKLWHFNQVKIENLRICRNCSIITTIRGYFKSTQQVYKELVWFWFDSVDSFRVVLHRIRWLWTTSCSLWYSSCAINCDPVLFYVQIKILRAHEIALACSKRPDSPPTLLIRIDPIFKRNGTERSDFSISIWLCVWVQEKKKKLACKRKAHFIELTQRKVLRYALGYGDNRMIYFMA